MLDDDADALLAREVLDAEQVTRLAAGLPLEEPLPSAACGDVAPGRRGRSAPAQKERATIVPALNKPIPQE